MIVSSPKSTSNFLSKTSPNNPQKEKLYVLTIHSEDFSLEELIISPEVFPGLKPGDLVEIYSPEKKNKKLLFKVPSLSLAKGI